MIKKKKKVKKKGGRKLKGWQREIKRERGGAVKSASATFTTLILIRVEFMPPARAVH